jgi:Zn-dependent protease
MFFQAVSLGAVTPGLAIAIILHEVAHGYVALRLGDPTAKYAGRLTLNPIKHVDLWGTILIPLFLILSGTGFVFGWAKPVPVNYYNLRYGKWGPVIVALAGPLTNFVLLVIFGLLARLSPVGTALPFLFATLASVNAILMFFNLLPIPPLDGSKVLYLFLDRRPELMRMLEQYGLFILVGILLIGRGLLSAFVFGPAIRLVQLFTGFSFF